MVMQWRNLWVVLMLCAISGWVHAAASLVAQLDRDRMLEHETVELTIAYSGDSSLELDLSPLSADFEVVGQSRSHHTRIVNGDIAVRQILKLQLAPLKTGSLVVPALQFQGARSDALPIVVDSSQTQDLAARSHFIEADVSTTTPWVQQQVIYRVRIFQKTPVIDGSLTEPEADGVSLERLGTDRSYRETREGESWDVHERRFALFPQRRGEVDLGAVRLLARVAADGGSSSSFFNRQTRQIRLRGPAITLDVKPAPDAVENWLPAAALNATANWIDADGARVGDPVMLEIILTAHGTQPSQLPELVLPEHQSARVYAGQSDSGQQSLEGGLVAQRRVRHQLVPREAGELSVEPLRVVWWRTTDGTQQTETVVIPPITVSPAVNGVLPDGLTPSENTVEAPKPQLADTPTTEPPANTSAVPNLAFTGWQAVQRLLLTLLMPAVIGLVLLGGFILLRFAKGRRDSGPKAHLRALRRAMTSGDRSAVQLHILNWAKMMWPTDRIRSIQDIGNRVLDDGGDAELARRIWQLDQRLHKPDAGHWQDALLVTELAKVRPAAGSQPTPSVGLPRLGAAWTDTVMNSQTIGQHHRQ